MANVRHHGRIDWKKFGRRIGREVKKTKLSYRELARELKGISSATLNRIVYGKRPVRAEIYLWLCREFEIDPMWAYQKTRRQR